MAGIKIILRAVLLITALVQVSQCASHLASRTPYDASRGPGFTTGTGEPTHDPYCRPVGIYAFVTPGSTNPSKAEIQEFSTLNTLKQTILDNAKNGKGELDPAWVQSLQNWELSFNPEEAGRLTEVGKQEAADYIQRLQNTFPDLFSSKQASSHYIRTTTNPAAKETSDIFTQALYGETKTLEEMKDLGERLEKGCVSWEYAKKEGAMYDEVYRNEILNSVLERVRKTLGVDSLDFDTLGNIYRLCTYESALNPNATSPWCSLFTEDELDELEYEEDLVSYWAGGPGSVYMSRKLTCGLLNSVIATFTPPPVWQKVVPVGKGSPKVTIELTHKVYQRVLAQRVSRKMFYDGQPPAFDRDVDPDRKWKSSAITPALGNVVFVLHQCGNKHYAVTTWVNERLVKTKLTDHYAGAILYYINDFAQDFGTKANQCVDDFCLRRTPF